MDTKLTQTSVARIMAVANFKGGVGKTTITVNLSDAIARMRRRVLVVDMDPQGNLSLTVCNTHPRALKLTVADLILQSDPNKLPLMTQQTIHHSTKIKGVSLLPANRKLEPASEEVQAHSFVWYNRLANILDQVKHDFDYILIDCPPRSRGFLLVNALNAASDILVPLDSGDEYSLDGLDDLRDTFSKVRHETNPGLNEEWLLINKHDRRKKAHATLEDQLIVTEAGKLLGTRLRESTATKDAAMFRTSVLQMNATHNLSRDYRKLAQEIILRVEGALLQTDMAEDADEGATA